MPVTSDYQQFTNDQILNSPVNALNGISEATKGVLATLNVDTVFDLATAPIFERARQLTHPTGPMAEHLRNGFVPAGYLDEDDRYTANPELLPASALMGISENLAQDLAHYTGIETITDLATWPPAVAAYKLAGFHEDGVWRDPEIPDELVPKLNEHATEKSTYSIYTTDPVPGAKGQELNKAINISKLLKQDAQQTVRTGNLLKYEQSWTPIALTLGNLLHSLALAPGESTRVAVVDWTRTQRVNTTESISQLDSLVNSMQQNRTINEITRALARESQQGFSNIDANSTVSNSAYTTYGVQNMEEALAAGAAGVGAGAATGAALGGVAGVGIGGVAGAVAGSVLGWGVGSVPGFVVGGAGGALLGGAIGVGSGGLVGGAAGGAMGFMGSAEFGSSVDSSSQGQVDVVTTTSSNGEREVESEMLQNISNRTQQHSSNARNRRASIVQEVSQSESETTTTRVVTNYNHMHALTIQYFEVVQIYSVQTRLVEIKNCLYVPIQPIYWTADLVEEFRQMIVASALNASVVYSLTTTAGTVAIHSPSFGGISLEWLQRRGNTDYLNDARQMLDDVVSLNPFNEWRIPETAKLIWASGTTADGGSPFGGHDSKDAGKVDYTFKIFTTDNQTIQTKQHFDDKMYRLGKITRIDLIISARAGQEFDFARFVEEPKTGLIRLSFKIEDEYGDGETLTVPVYYRLTKEMLTDDGLMLTLFVANKAMAMGKLLKHLNENTKHYTRQVLRSRNSPIVKSLLHGFSFNRILLANLVDPEPVAVTGDNLVFIMHASRKAATAEREDSAAIRNTHPLIAARRSIARRRPTTEEESKERRLGLVTEELVPVGTGGVFAEAVQGRANSAEKLDLTRFWDWQDSPIPILPPEIAPVVMGSRALSADVRPGSLDPSVLQLQSGTLPDPQGTAAVLTALQTELFRDMSGLAESAQLAQTALQAAASSAEAAGGQASTNLQKGMEHTTAIVEKVTEMTGEYGKLLADKGFGLMADVAKGALGSSGGGGVSGLLGGGTSAAQARTSQPSTTRTSGPLGQRNASIGGAVLNEARRGGVATGGAAVSGGVGGVGGSTSGTGPLGGTPSTPNGSGDLIFDGPGSAPDGLSGDIIREYGGVPFNSNEQIVPTNGIEVPSLSEIMPALNAAAQTDRSFFAAAKLGLDFRAKLQLLGLDDSEANATILSILAPAWNVRAEQAIRDINDGDLQALEDFDQLAAAALNWHGLSGGTDPIGLMSQINFKVEFANLQSSVSAVAGGEMVTVTGRVQQIKPDGGVIPAAGINVSMHGLPTEPEYTVGRTNEGGEFSLTLKHGVPPANFNGVHRHRGWFDLKLNLGATSPYSAMFNAEAELLIPGKIRVGVTKAWYDDDGTNAKIGSVIFAPLNRVVSIEFEVFKAGQPLNGHSFGPGDVTLNGAGQIVHVSHQTDNEGTFLVQYLADSADTAIAYIGVDVRHGSSQQAARADIELVG